MNWYQLPEEAVLSQRKYGILPDFRNILRIFQVLGGDLPEYIRWKIAMGLFYVPELAEEDFGEGVSWFCRFIQPEEGVGDGGKVLDWDKDGSAIIAGVNAVAGQEIRSLPFVHWWTFLSWFHAMPPGELSTRISLRQKLRKGQPLEDWEKEYYRENKALVDLRPAYTEEEKREIERLNKLLGA